MIGIVDNGFYAASPELAARINETYSGNTTVSDGDYSPDPLGVGESSHGTFVATVAAGEANNGVCACGVAFGADLAVVKIPATNFFSNLINALGHHDDEIDVKNFSLGFEGCTLVGGCQLNALDAPTRTAFQTSGETGRNGKGQILIWASSNEAALGGDTSMSGLAGERFNIMVGALGKNGEHASYSNYGAAVHVAAPGGDSASGLVVAGSLFNQAGTTGFACLAGAGTSYAAPMAAGVVALMLKTNPSLTARDVKGILALATRKTDENDQDWKTNAAGYPINHQYGFGAVDAWRAFVLADKWIHYPPEVSITGTNATVVSVPDDNLDGVTGRIEINFADNTTCANGSAGCDAQYFVVEHVNVFLTTTHATVRDLQVTLISPQNTSSRLMDSGKNWDGSADEYNNWKMLTVRCWGERPNGVWLLHIVDMGTGYPGDLSSWTLMIYGHIVGQGGLVPLTYYDVEDMSGLTPPADRPVIDFGSGSDRLAAWSGLLLTLVAGLWLL